MKVILVGTGTSHGVPVIACSCKVCTSKDNRNVRYRSSAFVYASDGTCIVIDTGPEFRLQALKYKLTKIDALLLTHSHADHIHGLDDVRIFSHTWNPTNLSENFEPKRALRVYANKNTLADIKNRFDYVFKETQLGGGKPRFDLVCTEEFSFRNPITIGCLEITPVPISHGKLPVCGWKIIDTQTQESFAYMSDCNYISNSSIDCIKNVDHCVLDCLREKKHSTHLNFEEGLQYAEKICAKHTWFTHICHDFSHSEIEEWIHKRWLHSHLHLAPAYDGLILFK